MTLGKKIGHLLWEQETTALALANYVGVSKQTAGRWKDDTGDPSRKELVAISRFFGVPIGWLADDEQDYPPATPRLLTGPKALPLPPPPRIDPPEPPKPIGPPKSPKGPKAPKDAKGTGRKKTDKESAAAKGDDKPPKAKRNPKGVG